MAWVIGYATPDEIEELRAREWEVEDPERYRLIGELPHHLMGRPTEGNGAVAIWVDTSVMKVFDGPDWDGAGESEEARQFIEKAAKLNINLDEQVHESKAQEASVINSAGIEAQLGYLLCHGGLVWLREYLEEDLKDAGS